jgi:hypothetical protein
MRVSIDEPWNHRAAVRVDPNDPIEQRHVITKGRLRADEDNLSFVCRDCRLTQRRDFSLRAASPRCGPGARRHYVGVDDKVGLLHV